MSLSIHNTPPYQLDPNAYKPDDFSTPEGSYYYLAILAGIRAIDYIFTRPDVDGQNLGLTGASQGGGLCTLIAGFDSRVKMITMSDPALAEQIGAIDDQVCVMTVQPLR